MSILGLISGFQKENIDNLSTTFFKRLYDALKTLDESISRGSVNNHATRHEEPILIGSKLTGAEDLIYIDKLGPASDNLRLNASISAHGLLPKLSGNSSDYLNGNGGWTSRICWDDLRFPAQGINSPGAASDPTIDSATGLLLFAGNLDNVIAGAAQMPHTWKAGTLVRPHLHLRFPTSNAGKNTRWKLEYDIANISGDWTNNSGTFTTLATITVANPANVKKHVEAGFGDLTMTGFTESAIILWKISRLAASDAADDDTNACLLVEFDVHYQHEKDGTLTEF